jgi:hypothetical protein
MLCGYWNGSMGPARVAKMTERFRRDFDLHGRFKAIRNFMATSENAGGKEPSVWA